MAGAEPWQVSPFKPVSIDVAQCSCVFVVVVGTARGIVVVVVVVVGTARVVERERGHTRSIEWERDTARWDILTHVGVGAQIKRRARLEPSHFSLSRRP